MYIQLDKTSFNRVKFLQKIVQNAFKGNEKLNDIINFDSKMLNYLRIVLRIIGIISFFKGAKLGGIKSDGQFFF